MLCNILVLIFISWINFNSVLLIWTIKTKFLDIIPINSSFISSKYEKLSLKYLFKDLSTSICLKVLEFI